MYRVADIVFDAVDCGEMFRSRAEKYRVFEGEPEFVISVSEEEIRHADGRSKLPDDGRRYMLSGFKFYFELIKRGGMMLHSSAVVTGGKAYLFSGPCGIGKSTHTSHWLELFPDAFILNDDKPAIRLLEDGARAYGTPWSGKHDVSRNGSAPIGAIAFIERAEENRIEPMPAAEAAIKLISQTVRHISRPRMDELLDTAEKLMETVPIYRLGCINDISAARLSSGVMINNKRYHQ
ncbi:MAG: hypothetical protein J5772_04480 [Clostridia bacterium]|nr:hypothetical protein [Clostridia bacterium]